MSQSAVAMFKALFQGRENCYGVHVPEQADPDDPTKKLKGQSFTKKEEWTEELFHEHLDGKTSVGMVPLRLDNTVGFAAIDIDVYPLDPTRYARLFELHSLPFVCFRSKSGGMHAFVFFKRPVGANAVVPLLTELKMAIGLAADTETFPKQTTASITSQGNWINLPYYRADATQRYAYDSDGKPLAFEEAMEYCWNRRTTLEALKSSLTHLPFSEGPPCLQRLYLTESVTAKNHNRNIFLFNVCVYLKARNPEDYESRLFMVNRTLPEPQDEEEIRRTILKSHESGDYSYQCEDATIGSVCNKQLCEKRKFGKSCLFVSDVNFEQLIQVASNPPYYKWKIDGVFMRFDNETELRKQENFQDYCIRYLKKCPNTLKQSVWYSILNKALKTMTVEEVSRAEEISVDSLLYVVLKEFFLERPPAQREGQVLLGQVFLHEETGGYCFRAKDLLEHVNRNPRLRSVSMNTIYDTLKQMGGHNTKLYDKSTQNAFRCWWIPQKAFEEESLDDVPSVEEMPSQSTKEAPAYIKKERRSKESNADRLRKMAEQAKEVEESPVPEVDFDYKNEDF